MESLNEIDFTFGKKNDKDPSLLKLFKVTYNPYHIEETFFSINDKIFAIEKNKNEIFIKFKLVPSGWCSGIVYILNENEYLRKRADVFIQLGENLYYFEGKS